MPASDSISILMSILLLVMFCIAFEVYAMRNRDTSRPIIKVGVGALLGLIAVGMMHFSVWHGNVEFDFRTVMLCLCGLFFGTIPTVVALVVAVAALLLQNIGVEPFRILAVECTYTVAAGVAGMIFHDGKRKWHPVRTYVIFAAVALISQSVMALCVYIVNPDIDHETIIHYAIILFAIMPLMMVLVGKMMTARISHFETETKLRIIEDKYYKLTLCNDDILWEFDPSAKVSYVSDNVTESLGYLPDELIGHKPHYFIDDVQSMRLVTDFIKNSEAPGSGYFRHELVLRHKKGHNIYFDTRCMALIDPETEKASGVVCVTHNVTNRHLHDELSRNNQKYFREQVLKLDKLQNEIKDYKFKLEQSKMELSEAHNSKNANAIKQMSLIANVCCEVTPTVDDMQKYINIVRDSSQPESLKSHVFEQMQAAVDFLKSATSDLIESDLLARGLTKLSIGICNIGELVGEVCDFYSSRNIYLLKKPIYLSSDIDLEDDEKTIKTDIQHLRRILNILLTNAYSFTNAGQVTLSCAKKSDSELVFSVSDTGIGIPDDAYKNTFLPMGQQETMIIKKYTDRHSGIGLNICKSLVELMGGHIWFDSKIGKGTNICFTIPFLKAGEIASQTNAQYNWSAHTALVATSDRYTNIFIGSSIDRTRIKHRCLLVSDENVDNVAAATSRYFKNYDIIITDPQAANTPLIRSIVDDNKDAATIFVDGSPNIADIYKQMNKHLTSRK